MFFQNIDIKIGIVTQTSHNSEYPAAALCASAQIAPFARNFGYSRGVVGNKLAPRQKIRHQRQKDIIAKNGCIHMRQ
jgi:hypothetical protein